ncbi:MAG: SDR family oxidoreductase [Myxococcota bacterium]|nr:short-chain dehydrogenase [Deltaproteobacteria bacterium]MDP6074898.1 SDR family oxidoreductase [Myxococcota bacterium]MBT40162.1 short-chain dehydrogenase [Deltaproteobacteria bacterium]MDP7074331.1 SDR family oxidoreductase [Myxococcota bacterium]MDP7300875.1 SDR family oxidoreductase [Myxococcota bacterium]
MDRRIALVTGASRGIGKATALRLAEAGLDVAITARTLREGERYEHSWTVKRSDTSAMPGSLEITAAAVEKLGRRALPVRMDLLVPASIEAAVARTREAFGRIDVLINNAVTTGPGSLDTFLDTPLDVLERYLRGNVLAGAQLTRLVLPELLERENGTVLNVTSYAGQYDPPAPAGSGGWSFAYAASKAAFHRLAGVLAVEHRDSGVRFFNLDPGTVATEMMQRNQQAQNLEDFEAVPMDVPAAAITWLATSPEAADLNGQVLHAYKLCKTHALVPGWPPAR